MPQQCRGDEIWQLSEIQVHSPPWRPGKQLIPVIKVDFYLLIRPNHSGNLSERRAGSVTKRELGRYHRLQAGIAVLRCEQKAVAAWPRAGIWCLRLRHQVRLVWGYGWEDVRGIG
ncbi:hypothetical protein PoB_003113900 [Plakobranchus ocellatus]|uniref:Uncharacterized protein n=1 Tax=Plakobranchus ocellatus TaxID=259542 RepID=A0AAV4AEF9_9GAST|nr:hypothetical protein PoB_003113900 [Plakobranchus ocellatus]